MKQIHLIAAVCTTLATDLADMVLFTPKGGTPKGGRGGRRIFMLALLH